MADVEGIDFDKLNATEIPLHLYKPEAGPPQALIDVQIGTRNIQLPIDSGFGFGGINLAPAVLQDLDVTYTGKTQTNWDAFGNEYESRQYVLPYVTIGDLAIRQVVGYEFRSGNGLPGVIALPFLRQFNVMFDYHNRKFGLYRRSSLPAYVKMPMWTKAALLPGDSGVVLPIKLLVMTQSSSFF